MARLVERILLRDPYDVVMARQRARELARNLGFTLTDQTRIATAVSEAARQALENQGSISVDVISDGLRRGIECICHGCNPQEPGAPPVPFGVPGGLRGIERLVDDFILRDEAGHVVLVMRKWQRQPAYSSS